MRTALVLAVAVLAGLAMAQEFSSDIPFSKATSVNDVKAEVQTSGKPAMVFVTQPWCGACKGLKSSVSGSSSLKALMKDFVVVHAAEGAGESWQFPGEHDGYVPRVYFLDKSGEFAAYQAPNPQYKYFLAQAGQIEAAAKSVLDGGNAGEL